MAKVITSKIRNFCASVLASMGALALLASAVPAGADCGEFLLSSSTLSEKIYRESLTQESLPAIGVLPEEVLALLGRESNTFDLFQLLYEELRIRRVRWGSEFKIKGGILSQRLLVMKHFEANTTEERSRYVLEFVRALFREKQRQLRFANPVRYVNELTAFSEKLATLTNAVALPRFNYAIYGLRSVFGLLPAKKLWPPTKPRLSFHWTLTRSFTALWITALVMNVPDIPKAIEMIETLYEIRGVVGEVLDEVKDGVEIDPIAERVKLVEIYEAKILEIEEQILAADPENLEELQERLESYRGIIESLRADMATIQARRSSRPDPA